MMDSLTMMALGIVLIRTVLGTDVGTVELLHVGTGAPSKGRGGSRHQDSLEQVESRREEVVYRGNATLGTFGRRPTCGILPVAFDETACDARRLSAEGLVVADRGICLYGEKALAVANSGGTALLVIDTGGGDLRIHGDPAFLNAHPQIQNITVASVSRNDGRRLRAVADDAKHRSKRLGARFLFDCELVESRWRRRENTSRGPTTNVDPVAAAVRRAMRPQSTAVKARQTYDGVRIDLADGTSLSAVGSFDDAFLASLHPPLSLEVRQLEPDCRVVVLDHPKLFALDLAGSCDKNLSFSATTTKKLALILPPPSDGLIFDNEYRTATSDVVIGVVVAPAAAARLRDRIASTSDDLQVAMVTPRHRLRTTWRELARLRDPAAWPRERQLRTQIYGVLRRTVAPGGDEEDSDLWAALQTIWTTVGDTDL